MKSIVTVFVLLLGLVQPSVAAQNPETVILKIVKVYIPFRFDDNDRAQAVIVGILPDMCFKAGPYEVKVNESNQTIRITQRAYHYKGICMTVTLPFSQVVELGILKLGTYELIDDKTGQAIGKLGVAQAKSESADDYVYAPVSEANVAIGPDKSKAVTLSGSFTSRCQSIQQVLISYYPEVVVVQPIIEFKASNEECKFERVAFAEKVALKPDLSKNFLLHVRSMDGQAINKLIDLSSLSNPFKG